MHNATPSDVGRGTLIFAVGFVLVLLCWSGLVYRYVQPGFVLFVLLAGLALVTLGGAVLWRAVQDIGMGHGSRAAALLLVPVVLLALRRRCGCRPPRAHPRAIPDVPGRE